MSNAYKDWINEGGACAECVSNCFDGESSRCIKKHPEHPSRCDEFECMHDIANAERKGHLHYTCPKCGEDITLYWIYYMEAKDGKTESTTD